MERPQVYCAYHAYRAEPQLEDRPCTEQDCYDDARYIFVGTDAGFSISLFQQTLRGLFRFQRGFFGGHRISIAEYSGKNNTFGKNGQGKPPKKIIMQ